MWKSSPLPVPLVYAAAGRSVYVLWHQDGRLRLRISHPAVVTSLALTADGNVLVTGSEDGTVRVWDPWVGKELAVLTGHEGPVRSVAIKDDGRWVLSAGSDRTVRLWDAAGKEEVAAFRKHASPVVAAAFLANGTQTVSGDRDLNLLPWKVDRFFAAAPVTPPDPPKPPDKIPPAKD
jgi:WD40 repeat protein